MYQRSCPSKKHDDKKECKCDNKKDSKWDDEKDCDHDDKKRCRRCEEPGKAILKCVCGNSQTNVVKVDIDDGQLPYFLGSVSINLCELCNPTTLIGISGVFTVAKDLDKNAGTIQVFRHCDGHKKDLIKTFPTTGNIEKGEVESFKYEFCATDDCCHDCVTYSFEFFPPKYTDADDGLAISNITITALSVEKKC